jgi:hypothetical protein
MATGLVLLWNVSVPKCLAFRMHKYLGTYPQGLPRQGEIHMDPAEMLTLAAIAYRGCEFNLSNPHSRKILYDEITGCLQTFSMLLGNWELVWGPAGYRMGNTGTDESAMYVVRGTREHTTLGIVVRGTNFFSLSDWMSNLLIDPKPWRYGGAVDDVKISHSTSRGLGILQRLRSGPIMAAPVPQSPDEQRQAEDTAAEAGVYYIC